jgi:hypothetical protein
MHQPKPTATRTPPRQQQTPLVAMIKKNQKQNSMQHSSMDYCAASARSDDSPLTTVTESTTCMSHRLREQKHWKQQASLQLQASNSGIDENGHIMSCAKFPCSHGLSVDFVGHCHFSNCGTTPVCAARVLWTTRDPRQWKGDNHANEMERYRCSHDISVDFVVDIIIAQRVWYDASLLGSILIDDVKSETIKPLQ